MTDVVYSYFNVDVDHKFAKGEIQSKINQTDRWLEHKRNSLWKLYHKVSHKVSGANRGRVCLRIERPTKETEGKQVYRVSFSFCSFLDNFNRKVARKIADGRMKSGAVMEIVLDHKATLKSVSNLAINRLVNESLLETKNHVFKTPRWLCDVNAVSPAYRGKHRPKSVA